MSSLPRLAVSIVIHRQAALAKQVLHDLAHCTALPLEVILTVNVPEALPFDARDFSYPITVIDNPRPKGFGANHNAAFARATAPYFFVLNPDLHIHDDVFPRLVADLSAPALGAVAPLVLRPDGAPEDSARRFPTPAVILKKALFGANGPDYQFSHQLFPVDWIAGMFMGFRSETFKAIGGFDDRYFLYYEDVDLCWRLSGRGYHVAVDPAVSVVHEARRTSRRNLRYMRWHIHSMLTFWLTHLRSRKPRADVDR